jgi:hypothetical protein
VPGGLYQEEQYGLIVVDAAINQKKRRSGTVLVEHEPIRFEITEFVQGRLRSEEKAEVAMQDVVDSSEQLVFNLTFDRTVYFGRGHSVPTGSPVTLIFSNGTRMDFDWGVKKRVPEWRMLRMMTADYATERGITVVGTKVRQRLEFSASMMTHFEDGAILARPIRGVYQVRECLGTRTARVEKDWTRTWRHYARRPISAHFTSMTVLPY